MFSKNLNASKKNYNAFHFLKDAQKRNRKGIQRVMFEYFVKLLC